MRAGRIVAAALALALLAPGCVLRISPEEPTPRSTPAAPTPPFPAGAPTVAPGPAPTPPATPSPSGPDGSTPTPPPPEPTPPPPATPPPPEAPPAEPAPPAATPSPAPASPAPTGPTHAQGPAPAPALAVRLAAGLDAGPDRLSRYVPAYALAGDGSRLDVALRGVPDATVTIGSLFRLENADAAARTVRVWALASPPEAVRAAHLRVHDGAGGTLALLDLVSGTATADVLLPAGSARDVAWTLTLAEGAGNANASFSTVLTLGAPG